ncbi:MAG TPA: endopeptidase, partial [Myxococcaceae bacterium]|nr:endopeptidase [Myxococcaceae bacterium]
MHPENGSSRSQVARNAFVKSELSISSNNLTLGEARGQGKMNPARERALNGFFQRYGKDFNVYIEPRSGAATNIQGHIPMIPGNGVDNRVTLSSLGQGLGRAVSGVDESVVGDLVVQFAREHAEVLGIDASQLGQPRVTQVTEHLWQVHIPQQVRGIPVREGRLAATISHGNLVLIGTEGWADVKLRTLPLVAADQALERGLARAGLTHSPKSIWKDANLEVVPIAQGEGFGHKLVWSFGFQDEGDEATWEVLVDAHQGEVV